MVDAALSSLSGLTAQPNLNSLVAVLAGSECDPGLDQDGLQQLANYWETVREYYAPFESGLKSGTAEVYHHEIPGGQYSNYKPQVAGLGLLDRWEECKDMYRKVNLLFGDIVKVTPSSKVVGDMAMFLVKNNLEPEDLFTDKANDLAFPESVIGLFKGMLGQPHGGFPRPCRRSSCGAPSPSPTGPASCSSRPTWRRSARRRPRRPASRSTTRRWPPGCSTPTSTRSSPATARSSPTPR